MVERTWGPVKRRPPKNLQAHNTALKPSIRNNFRTWGFRSKEKKGTLAIFSVSSWHRWMIHLRAFIVKIIRFRTKEDRLKCAMGKDKPSTGRILTSPEYVKELAEAQHMKDKAGSYPYLCRYVLHEWEMQMTWSSTDSRLVQCSSTLVKQNICFICVSTSARCLPVYMAGGLAEVIRYRIESHPSELALPWRIELKAKPDVYLLCSRQQMLKFSLINNRGRGLQFSLCRQCNWRRSSLPWGLEP